MPEFDGVELQEWAEKYGHPEEWAKRAQDAHARAERLEAERGRYRAALEDIKSVCDERTAGGTGWDYVVISNFVRRTLYDAAAFGIHETRNAAASAPRQRPDPEGGETARFTTEEPR